MKIIVDGFGGDNAPLEVLRGCRMAADEYDAQIVLSGSEEKLRAAAEKAGISLEGIGILPAASVLSMEDSPRDVLRAKADSSMAVGLRAVAEGQGDAFVSAGSTGALAMGATLIVRPVKGVRRVALATVMPAKKGCYLLLDVGANVECRAEMLLQFALMGSVYMEQVLGVKNPRVGLVNIGTEETKGTKLQHEAFALLKASTCNFIGNAEARDIPFGVCDVAVADGFTGNVILKLTEGVGLVFASTFKKILTRSLLTKLGALTMMKGIAEFKKQIDYTEYGGAPFLGASKPVIKAHGSSNAVAFKNAVRQAIACAKGDISGKIEANMPAAEAPAEERAQ